MPLAQERTKSLLRTREFLLSLLDPKQTPHTPKSVRQEAQRLVKHFPSAKELCLLARGDGQILSSAVVETHLAKHASI